MCYDTTNNILNLLTLTLIGFELPLPICFAVNNVIIYPHGYEAISAARNFLLILYRCNRTRCDVTSPPVSITYLLLFTSILYLFQLSVSRHIYLSFPPCGLLTSLTANKNWMAHTKRQHKLSDSVNAHKAKVTSYTTTYSSAVITVNCSARSNSLMSLAVTGEIFRRKIKDNSASNKLTRHRSPRLTSISLTPICFDLEINLFTDVFGLRALEMLRPPFRALLPGVRMEFVRKVCLDVSKFVVCVS